MKKNVAVAPHLKDDAYANVQDFGDIFATDMESLYVLSLLLTGSREEAELCFAQALEDCTAGNRVFKAWAKSWSRLSVVERALRMKKPRIVESAELALEKESVAGLPMELASVLRLDDFRRFVYVLTVLERYSIRDAAILLKHPKREIAAARMQAIGMVGTAAVPVNASMPLVVPAALSA